MWSASPFVIFKPFFILSNLRYFAIQTLQLAKHVYKCFFAGLFESTEPSQETSLDTGKLCITCIKLQIISLSCCLFIFLHGGIFIKIVSFCKRLPHLYMWIKTSKKNNFNFFFFCIFAYLHKDKLHFSLGFVITLSLFT